MPEIQYVEKKWAKKTLAIVEAARRILAPLIEQGYTLTLRQLYYQFVSEEVAAFPDSWIDPAYNKKHRLPANTKNTEKNYKRLGNIISNARLCGLIDWDWIVDRTRFLRGIETVLDPIDALRGLANTYALDHWDGQQTRIEVWVEKDALIGVLERPCDRWKVDYFACKGNVSQSALYAAAQRMTQRYMEAGQDTLVLHLADHDPTGWDMTRDLADRMETFGTKDFVEIRRIALNMDQIRKYKPSPNPTKWTDSRAKRYVAETGATDSWELDALKPQTIDELITKQVKKTFTDKSMFDAIAKLQKRERSQLHRTAASWSKVKKLLSGEAQARIGAAAITHALQTLALSEMSCRMLRQQRDDLSEEAIRIKKEEQEKDDA